MNIENRAGGTISKARRSNRCEGGKVGMRAALQAVAESSSDAGARSWDGAKVHLIGIGGCGMRGAAALVQHLGARVSGSDQAVHRNLDGLLVGGAVVYAGHRADQLPDDADWVVISAAVPEDNPELQRARSLGHTVVTYAELLGLLMQERKGVAVAGTHGKSTTTGLTAYIYRLAGLDPSFIVGAHCRQLGGSSAAGAGQHMVVESCEFGRSFLHQHPQIAAILNIESDHLDYYEDLNDIIDAFSSFAGNVGPDGVVVAKHRMPAVARATVDTAATVETFGVSPEATWHAADIRMAKGVNRFSVRHRGEFMFETPLALAGLHNVFNALAATALAWHGGANVEAIAEGIATFQGVDRRMTLRSSAGGVTVVDDYAHHPTEISATLEALRTRYTPRRTWVVFQPHQYSRTRLLMDEFATCFDGADTVLVPDIYASRDSEEDRRSTGSAELVARIGERGGRAEYLPSLEEVTRRLVGQVDRGDLVVTMGAGDVWKVADGLAEQARRAD
ncbi:MAG: UDP-N-acetylmuramate--L-alanine ligase [Phycisphaerae bacterium]